MWWASQLWIWRETFREMGRAAGPSNIGCFLQRQAGNGAPQRSTDQSITQPAREMRLRCQAQSIGSFDWGWPKQIGMFLLLLGRLQPFAFDSPQILIAAQLGVRGTEGGEQTGGLSRLARAPNRIAGALAPTRLPLLNQRGHTTELTRIY